MSMILKLPRETEAKIEMALAKEKLKQNKYISKAFFIETLINRALSNYKLDTKIRKNRASKV